MPRKGTKKVKKKCDIMEAACRLVKEIDAEKLPIDFKPHFSNYDEILAEIRHDYTNYMDLLHELPLCEDTWKENRSYCKKVANQYHLVCIADCPFLREAHDILKWKAKEKAEQIYSAWLEEIKKTKGKQ